MGIFKIATVIPSAKHLTFPPTATFFQVARVGPQMRRWRQRLGSESGQLGSCWTKAKDLNDGFWHGRRLANVRRFFWCLLKGTLLFFFGFLVKQNRRRGWDISMCFGASRTEWRILTNLWIVPEWWVSLSISLKTFKYVQQRIFKFVVGRSWSEVSWAAAYDSWQFQTPGATLVAGLKGRACWSSNFLLSRMTGVFDVWRILRGSYEAALLGLCIDLSILCF